MANIDNIDDATTVRELEVNDTAYDIVGKGVLDQNSRTTNLEWIGTKAEYEALGTYSDKCTYIITDDSADSQSYEIGVIAEEVNTIKGYDYVVDWQTPAASNNYTWYRKYKSGWVEQGGTLSGKTVTFPVPFLHIPTIVTSLHSADTAATRNNMISSVTTTSFSGGQLGTNKDWTGAYGDMTGDWAAFGIAA